MDKDNLKKQKIKMWQDKLEALQKEYKSTMVQRGEAASQGDLRENAAYAMLTEQGEVLSARIAEYQKIIHDFEKGAGS